ncbi:hypothetical protein SAY86_011952 [Trapa natans]|uniref:Eukaryotic translation initiation factor 4G n=1 Tax=Trapa natans TaxID=22666 RepID=A0AAN7MAN2_TRANT|nr:hypothetical protein SAY86_011952 [Trapa natans]
MSFSQSRAHKSDSAQYRKSGRSESFNQLRTSSGTHGEGGALAPSHSLSSSVATNRSFKKPGNAPGGQPGANLSLANHHSNSRTAPSAPPHTVQVDASAQSQTQDALSTNTTVRLAETNPASSPDTKTVSKAPTSQSTSMNSDNNASRTLVKGAGDASNGFSFQFGSISPGFVNGMQIPARTSSAPPNIDEQKREEAHNGPVKAVPPIPIHPSARPHLPRKDLGSADHESATYINSSPKARNDSQGRLVTPPTQAQNIHLHQVPRMSMPMSYHQSPVPVNFMSPNSQIQSQGMPRTPIQLQMQFSIPLQVANAPGQLQQQMFVQGIQPHQLPSQGTLHGQTISFPQPSLQLGNLGMGIGQYSQQQGGQVGASRKVSIKDPHTNQEVRLLETSDAVSSGRPLPNVPSISQPAGSYPHSQQFNYYHNYNQGLHFSGPGSLSVPGSQIAPASLVPRYNYPVKQVPQSTSFSNAQGNNLMTNTRSGISKQGISEQAYLDLEQNPCDGTSSASSFTQEAVKKVDSSLDENAAAVSSYHIKSADLKIEQHKISCLSGECCQQESDFGYGSSSTPQTQREPSSDLLSVGSEQKLARILSSPRDDAEPSISSADHSPVAQENYLSTLGTTAGMLEPGCESTAGGDAVSIVHSRSNQKNHNLDQGGDSPSPEISDSATTKRNVEPGSQRDDDLSGETNKGEKDQGCLGCVVGTKDTSCNPEYGSGKLPSRSSGVEGKQESACNLETTLQGTLDRHDEGVGRVGGSISTLSNVDGVTTDHVLHTVIPESGNGISILKEVIDSTDDSKLEIPEKTTTDGEVKGKSATKADSEQVLSSNDKPISQLNRSKSMTKGKKKKKEFLQKADAAGANLDLYTAYKGPEEKKEITMSSESAGTASLRINSKMELADTGLKMAVPSIDRDESKAELDDWEEAADISTPKLESMSKVKPVLQEGHSSIANKYSRDFLLKFADQCTYLPDGFEITSDIAEVFTAGIDASRSFGHDPRPSPGRQSMGPGLDRRGSGARDDDRWNKVRGDFSSGQDLHLDVGFGGTSAFRNGHGGNFGVLRNPRAQSPIQHTSGVLPGLMQPPGSQGGLQRTGPNANRWQHASGFQRKGLIPSPQTPLQMMHKAEKKYEVGNITDEEQAKQRQLKAILNKLTPENFERLFKQVKEVGIDNAVTLTGFISQIFDKALMEPTFCEMYANLCSHLSLALPDFTEGDEKINFKRLLVNKCQEEFERGEREELEANKVEEESEVEQSDEQREEKRSNARRRMLGNIRLIGELYKKKMLTEKIMHECMKKLLGQYQIPDEEHLEALCKLMSTIGEMIDHPKAKVHMDAYFDRMMTLSNNMTLSLRVRFMLKDSIDLRKNKWQHRRKVEGPKKIDEVHRDAVQERHSQAGRVGRSPSINPPGRRGQQMEFATRGNPLSSPNSFRGLPSQARGHGAQDVCFEERQPFEQRTLSIPLSQKSMGDDAITLGPQGGLGRGMSVRGSSSILGSSLSDHTSGAVDSRRNPVGLNGSVSMVRTNSYSSRENSTMRSAADLHMGPASLNQMNTQGGRDVRSPRYTSDRQASAHLSPRGGGVSISHSTPSKTVFPEVRLRDMSNAAIREYYSAKDEKEVALCIKDLNSPSFYPIMVSLWVLDSFERKDMERDLLTDLLISISKPQSGMLSQRQLIQGFESVLTSLEDAVNDAPKAPAFLGRIFGKVVAEDVIPLSEIGRILYEGGEEQGQLLEAGLAADVLGYSLEVILSDKGEAALNEIRKSSNIQLEDFRPPGSMVSRILEKFILSH